MNRRIICLLLFIPILSGCNEEYYVYSPRGCFIESLSDPYSSNVTTCNDAWYYASDSILVKNVDVSRVNKEISQRVFSSNDIKKLRLVLNSTDVYFEIKNAYAVNLGKNKIIPDINTVFLLSKSNAPHMFYIEIPYKKRKWFHFTYYSYEYPVTYFKEGDFIVHDKKNQEATYDTIKQSLYIDVDSIDVERWIERCRQGKQKLSYFINEGRALL